MARNSSENSGCLRTIVLLSLVVAVPSIISLIYREYTGFGLFSLLAQISLLALAAGILTLPVLLFSKKAKHLKTCFLLICLTLAACHFTKAVELKPIALKLAQPNMANEAVRDRNEVLKNNNWVIVGKWETNSYGQSAYCIYLPKPFSTFYNTLVYAHQKANQKGEQSAEYSHAKSP